MIGAGRMRDLKWIKLTTDMFDNRKIKHLRKLPEGNNIVLIWVMLLTLAGKCNAGGFIFLTENIPYTHKMLADELGFDENIIKISLNALESFGMICREGESLSISGWKEHQNIEGMDKIREQNRIRKQRERDRKRALLLENPACDILEPPDLSMAGKDDFMVMSRDMSREVTKQREEEEKEEEIDNISSKDDIVGRTSADTPEKPKKENLRYNQIKDDFHAICTDLPQISAISESRQRAVRALLNELEKLKIMPGLSPYDKLRRLFQLVQDSDFLTGRNGRWGGCSFDWIFNRKNALKILEGNYANKGGVNNGGRSTGTGINRDDSSGGAGTSESAANEALELFRRIHDGDKI